MLKRVVKLPDSTEVSDLIGITLLEYNLKSKFKILCIELKLVFVYFSNF